MIKQEFHTIKGIQRDLTVSRFNPEFAYDAQNIRLTAREGSTLLSVTNERGNELLSLKDPNSSEAHIQGTVIGYNVLNDYLTLFSTLGSTKTDYIYRLEKKKGYFECKTLYSGNLNFNIEKPIESLGVYENENIQKVYWVDGLNQARVINIAAADNIMSKWNDTSFDFVQELNLDETITIQKNTNTAGLFAPGVIQYAFTYYNLYGQESNIFYSTPLQYISFDNRGASPEEKVSNSFTITINNPDPRFDYIRIYSIHRTSIDATPTVLNVTDIAINGTNTLTYTDNGTSGVNVDPTELLYIGGESITPKTMSQKDNTLFLGNILLNNKVVDEDIRTKLQNHPSIMYNQVFDSSGDYSLKGYYSYTSSLKKNSNIRGFKYLEWYRFGVQFQNKTGKWSEAVFLGDAYNNSAFPNTRYKVNAYYNMSPEIVKAAVNQGFIRARGIVVYPSYTDREVIAQGILCPTVYNLENRYDNAPYAQSSWFIRPNIGVDGNSFKFVSNGNYQWYNYSHKYNGQYYDIANLGAWAEFRHNYPIPDNWKRNAEIQCLANVPSDPYVTNTDTNSIVSWIASHKEYFFVDQNIVTFHSPDIEFDDALSNLDISGVKLRIVGNVTYTANASDIDIQTSTPQNDTSMPGFYKESMGVENINQCGVKSLVSGLNYIDKVYDHNKNMTIVSEDVAFMVYPWSRNGSLNNQPTLESDDKNGTRTAMLSSNKRSNLKFAGYTEYLSAYGIWKAYVDNDNNHTGISGAVVFNSDEQSLIKIPAPKNSNLGDINYYGNVDKIVTPSRNDEEYQFKFDEGAGWDYDVDENGSTELIRTFPLNKKNGYPIVGGTDMENNTNNFHNFFVSSPVPIWLLAIKSPNTQHIVNDEKNAYGTDPVSIKYKSGPHAVLAFNYTKDKKQVIMPTISDYTSLGNTGINYVGTNLTDKKMPWDLSCTGVYQDVIPYSQLRDTSYGYSWLAELYRDDITDATRFGGKTEEAISNNQWLPAGEPVSLISGYDESNNPIAKTNYVRIDYTEGDTYFQRYDCLKTYPYTNEDQNSVVEIASFMCETRVNIDGRYDKNRGQTNNMNMSPTNFNLLNKAYSQSNNFFNYRALNYSKYSLDYFPNTVTWTKEKSAGATIDTWTNITMASTLDLDGDKGEVVSLNTFNNEVYCFQKQGLSNILFNSRIQIPTSDGVPIEITNGLKVTGKRYISNSIGCNNKWSIAESPSGLYFIDNITNSLYLFNGQIESLSDKLGFRQWISDNNSQSEWNPNTFYNFITFYDKNNNDVYFVNRDTALVYSELLGQFTSFMSYGKTYAMFNIDSDFYAIDSTVGESRLWEQFAGDYNMFFGEYKPYSITFIANADEPYDKIFNNLEFRADCWSGNNLSNNTFDALEVWNEYQRGVSILTMNNVKPYPLKKKFRVWRANIPRANVDWNGVKANNRDRIRNTWAYIRLSRNIKNTEKMQFHDAIVRYFV